MKNELIKMSSITTVKEDEKTNKNKNKTTPLEKTTLIPTQTSKSIEDLEVKEEMDVVMEKWSYRKIVRALRKGKIIIDHDFQRDEIYKTIQKSGIIVSAISGKSIPPIYAYEERDEKDRIILSIIDGQQRLSSIRGFLNGEYALKIPYGEYSVLNNYTYDQIKKLNEDFAEQIADITQDIAVIRNINKEQAQEYFGIINTTTTPLSPGEKIRSLNEPAKTILKQIINNPYFVISNFRKTRKAEYMVAVKILWNQMFLNPLSHEFVGNKVQEFMTYFNSTEDIALIEKGARDSLHLLKIYSQIFEETQYSPRSHGDFYSTICFLSVLQAKNQVNVEKLSKFMNWIFKGINKKVYPITLQEQFEHLLWNRLSSRNVTSPKDFVIMLETLYNEEEKVWLV